MNARMLAAMVAVSLSGGTVFGDDDEPAPLKAKPITTCSWGFCPEGVNNGMLRLSSKPVEPGFNITYLVAGENLIGIKRDSLVIESIRTPNGVDLSRGADGEPAYEVHNDDISSDVSKDGKCCTFSFAADGDFLGKVETSLIKGSAIALLGTQWEQKTVVVNMDDSDERTIGPFSVCVRDAEDLRAPTQRDDTVDLWGSAMATAVILLENLSVSSPQSAIRNDSHAAVGPSPQNHSEPDGIWHNFGIQPATNTPEGEAHVRLVGPIEHIRSIRLKAEGQKLDTSRYLIFVSGRGTIDTANNRYYCVPKPKDGKVSVTLDYWTDVKEAKVVIGE